MDLNSSLNFRECKPEALNLVINSYFFAISKFGPVFANATLVLWLL